MVCIPEEQRCVSAPNFLLWQDPRDSGFLMPRPRVQGQLGQLAPGCGLGSSFKLTQESGLVELRSPC